MRLPIIALCLVGIALAVPHGSAQSTPAGRSLCDEPSARGTAAYNHYCGACYPHCGNVRNSNNDNGAAAAAAAAAEAEAAAAAKRQRDAELEHQRIDAENRRIAEEAEKQAKFDQDKREALGQLKGIANGDDFDSASGLKGVGSADSGLKDTSNLGDSAGLKTLPAASTDPMVVDARNVPTGLPKSVEAEIPDTPAGNRVRKGFQAIQDHDWKVALAWFQDALNHEPGNAGIQRLIELAQFTMEREKRPHPSAAPAMPAPATHAQVKAAPVDPDRLMDTQMNADDSSMERDRQALNKQMDTQMNADLAKSIDAFNRNYYLRHPELSKPAKPSSSSQSTKPATVAPASESPAADEKAKWNLFFNNLFTPPPINRSPTSVSGVRG